MKGESHLCKHPTRTIIYNTIKGLRNIKDKELKSVKETPQYAVLVNFIRFLKYELEILTSKENLVSINIQPTALMSQNTKQDKLLDDIIMNFLLSQNISGHVQNPCLLQGLYSSCFTTTGAAQGFEKWHGTFKVMSNSITTIYNTYNNNQNQEVIL